MRPVLRVGADVVHRNFRAPWLLVATATLMVGGWTTIRLGQRDLAEQQITYGELIQSRLQSQMRAGTAVGRAAEPGLRVVRAPNAGVVLVQGNDSELPAAWEFTPGGVEVLSPYVYSQRLQGLGDWDIEVLVRIIASLFALGLGLIAVLEDRSSGWTSALQTLPLPPMRVTAARIAGDCLTLASVVSATWIAMSVALATGGSSALIWRLWLTAPMAALLLWTSYGVGAASAWASRVDARAILTALAIWVGLVMLGPALVSLTAELTHPVAPVGRMERERREVYADGMRFAENAVAQRLVAGLPASVNLATVDIPATREFRVVEPEWQRLSSAARRSASALEAQWRDDVRAQKRLVAGLAWFSPGALASITTTTVVGTGWNSGQAWTDAVAQYGSVLNSALFDNRPIVNLRVTIGESALSMAFTRHPAPRFTELPVFETPDRSWHVRLAEASKPSLGLAVWAIGALAVAFFAGVRELRS